MMTKIDTIRENLELLFWISVLEFDEIESLYSIWRSDAAYRTKNYQYIKVAHELIQEVLKKSTGIYRTIQIFRAEQKEPSKFLYFYFGRRCTGEW